MEHRSGTVRRVIRPNWKPQTDDERGVVAELRRLRRQAANVEKAIWAAIAKGRELDIPDTTLCDESGESRSTLNRRLGPRGAGA
jgi:hypothetical protein